MNTHRILGTSVIRCLLLCPTLSAAAIPLYEYGSASGNDPSSQGWTVIGAGEMPSLVSTDGATASGWRLCDSATNGALGIVYDANGRVVSGDWSVTMGLRWEKDKYDASGNVPVGGNGYFLDMGRQGFVWRVGDGNLGYYEVRFGKGEGATVTASGSSSSSTPVSLAGFGEDVELTLAVSQGQASLMIGDRVILEQVDWALSDEESCRMFFGDPTGGAQGSVALHSVRFIPEPSAALLALAGSGMLLARRRRAVREPR